MPPFKIDASRTRYIRIAAGVCHRHQNSTPYAHQGNDPFIVNITGGTFTDISDPTKTEEVFDLT